MGVEGRRRIDSVWQLPVRISVTPLVPSSRIMLLVLLASALTGAVAGSMIVDAERVLMVSLVASSMAVDVALLSLCASFSSRFDDRLSEQSSSDDSSKSVAADLMKRAIYALVDYLDNRVQRLLHLALVFLVSGLMTIVLVSFVNGVLWLKTSALVFVTVGSAWMIFECISYMRTGHLFLKPKFVFPVRGKDGSEYISVAWQIQGNQPGS